MATAARGRAARLEILSRRAEETARQRQLDREAAAQREREEAARLPDEAARLLSSHEEEEPTENDIAESETVVSDGAEDLNTTTTTTPGVACLETLVTIDGTEVHLTAHVKNGAGAGEDRGVEGSDQPTEILLVAVDKKARRSSKLSLNAADIAEIVGTDQDGSRGSKKIVKGSQGVLSAVLQKLTVFNSRRKDLFILSYKGKKVVAPH